LQGVVGDVTPQDITTAIQTYLPLVKEVACLKTTDNNTLCATQTLTNVEQMFGTLSVNNIAQVVPRLLNLQSLPANIVCTGCMKQTFNIIKTNIPAAGSPDVISQLTQTCGASFVDGAQPSNVAEGTGAAAPKTTGGSSGGSTGASTNGAAATLVGGGFIGSIFSFGVAASAGLLLL